MRDYEYSKDDRRDAIKRRRDIVNRMNSDKKRVAKRKATEEENKKNALQPGLEIGAPDDVHEQQADAVAKKVVAGEDASGSMQTSTSPQISKKEEEGTLMAKGEDGTLAGTGQLQTTLDSSKGGGEALDDKTKNEMGSKMGADLGDVKIHTDSKAHEMSEGINAKAFTHGNDIYFKQGNFDTGSNAGKELLAHELAHTQQQKDGVDRKVQREEEPGEINLASSLFAGVDELKKILNNKYSIGKGNTGEGVKRIKIGLVQLSYLKQEDVNEVFDRKTKKAVEAFQEEFKLKSKNGVVGPETMAKLDELLFAYVTDDELKNAQSAPANDLAADLASIYDETPTAQIYLSAHRPDLHLFPLYYSRKEIAKFLYGDENRVDDFDIVDNTFVSDVSDPRKAVKSRYPGQVSTTFNTVAPPLLNSKLTADTAKVSSLVEQKNYDDIRTILLEWSQFSDLTPALGKNYFDVFLAQIDKEVGLDFLLEELTDSRYVWSDQVKKAITLRSAAYSNKAEYHYEKDNFFNLGQPNFQGYRPIAYQPVIGRYLVVGETSKWQVVAVMLITSGTDLSTVETAVRNADASGTFENDVTPYAKAIIPVKQDSGKLIYTGVLAAFKSNDPNYPDFDYRTKITTGNFYWYYPNTIFIPSDTFKEDYKETPALRKQRINIGRDALSDLQTGNILPALALDYDVLKTIASLQPEEQLVKNEDIIGTILLGVIAFSGGDFRGRVALISRVLASVSSKQYTALMADINSKGYFKNLVELSKNLGSEDIEEAFFLAQVLTQQGIQAPAAKGDNYKVYDKQTFKLGKEKEGDNYFLVSVEIKEVNGVAGFVFNQQSDETWQNPKTTAISEFIAANTLVQVLLTDGQTMTVTAAALAVVATAMSQMLQDNQSITEIMDFISTVLIIASFICPVLELVDIIGVAGLRALVLVGSRGLLAEILTQMILRKGFATLGRLVLDVLLLEIMMHEEDIKKTKNGQAWLNLFHIVLGIVVARDLNKLIGSQLYSKLLTTGAEVLSELRVLNNSIVAGKVAGILADIQAAVNATAKIVSGDLGRILPALKVVLIDGGELGAREALEFNKVFFAERAKLSEQAMLATLGKATLEEAPALKAAMTRLKGLANVDKTAADFAQKTMRAMEKMSKEALEPYAAQLNKLLSNSVALGNSSRYYEFIAASTRPFITNSTRVLEIAEELGALGPARFSDEALNGIAQKIAGNKITEPCLEWMSGIFKTAKPEDYQLLNFLAKRTDTPWIEYFDTASAYKKGTATKQTFSSIQGKIRGAAGEFVTETANGGKLKAQLEGVETEYTITDDQVNLANKKRIDFEVTAVDDAGNKTLAEVKAWRAETFAENLAAYEKGSKTVTEQSRAYDQTSTMLDQLSGAYKETGHNPILVISNDIKGKTYDDLIRLLKTDKRTRNFKVMISRISETDVVNTGNSIRAAIGL